MESVLSVSGAKRRFGDVVALDGVDLRLERGGWLGLLGPNGAGKSTLVRAIAGRIRLDAGTMSLLGHPLDASGGDPGGARARLGVVPQEVALYGRLTGRENLETFGALHGVHGATLRERVERALDWTGLRDRAGDRVLGYSGGMQRRLNLACSTLHEPEVLLLDEPTAGVDPQSRERIWEMLGELRARGASLVLTTHQLDEAQKTCERIVILDRGRVVAEGTFAELVERTVGKKKRLVVTLAGPSASALGAQGFDVIDARTITRPIGDARELPGVLEAITRTPGIEIENLQLEEPSLQAVFLRLTGKELRD